MAQRRTRRRFTQEYKAQAIQRLMKSGKPLADIAAELDVSPGQLNQWRNEELAAGSAYHYSCSFRLRCEACATA